MTDALKSLTETNDRPSVTPSFDVRTRAEFDAVNDLEKTLVNEREAWLAQPNDESIDEIVSELDASLAGVRASLEKAVVRAQVERLFVNDFAETLRTERDACERALPDDDENKAGIIADLSLGIAQIAQCLSGYKG